MSVLQNMQTLTNEETIHFFSPIATEKKYVFISKYTFMLHMFKKTKLDSQLLLLFVSLFITFPRKFKQICSKDLETSEERDPVCSPLERKYCRSMRIKARKTVFVTKADDVTQNESITCRKVCSSNKPLLHCNLWYSLPLEKSNDAGWTEENLKLNKSASSTRRKCAFK